MAGTLGSLIVDISADVARLRKDMGTAKRTVSGAMSSVRKAASVATAALGGLGGGLAAGLSGRAIREAIADISGLYDVSQKLGLAAEDLQAYQYAAVQVGLSQRTANLALQRFTRRVGEAAQGTGELRKTLEAYGIQVRDNNGRIRDSQAILGDLAEEIKNAGSANEQLLLAFKAFDAEGAGFVNVMRNGREGLKRLKEEARAAGLVIDEEAVAAAKRLDGWLTQVSYTISTKFKAAIASIAEEVSRQGFIRFFDETELEKLRKAREGLKRLREQRDNLEAISRGEGSFWDQFRYTPEQAKEALGPLNKQIETVAENIKAALNPPPVEIPKLDKPQTPPTPPPLGSTGAGKRTPADEARDFISALREQTQTFGLTAEQMDVYRAAMLASKVTSAELREELVRTAADAAAAQQAFTAQADLAARAEAARQSLRTPFDEATDALDNYDELLDANLITMNEWAALTNKALDEAAGSFDDLKDQADDTLSEMEKLFERLGDDIENSITDAVTQSTLSLSSLKDLATSILDDIARSVVQQHIATPIRESIAGFLPSLFPGRAAGGPVTAGRSYIVGERGPELFTPGASGMVSANGAGNRINVYMDVKTPDANSFRYSERQIGNQGALLIQRSARNL